MELIINNKLIEASIPTILTTLRHDTGDIYFNYIGKDGFDNVKCTCPWHKHGVESHPSCFVYNNHDDPEIEYGLTKCFTCGQKAPLYSVVGYCFGKDDNFGKDWLVDNFGSIIPVSKQLPELRLEKKKHEKIILDPSILNDYNYFHPYMTKRKLTPEVVSKYKVGYDPETDCITFPCWDINNNLVAVNRRSVTNKTFRLVSNVNKEIYLLNYAIAEHAENIYIAESLINALNLNSYGYTAVALLGTGSKELYLILKRVGIRSVVLCLDPDTAGRVGTLRFIKNMLDSCFINIKDLPDGKDVNDLTYIEFEQCPILSIDEWCTKYNMKI